MPESERSPEQIRNLRRLVALREQAQGRLQDFAQSAASSVRESAEREVARGLGDSETVVRRYFTTTEGRRLFNATFSRLGAAQVETLLGFLGPASPLTQSLRTRLGPAVADRLMRKLVDGLALGRNPNDIARLARNELGVGLTWALTTVRSANLWAYRNASSANYRANRDVVSGWIWWAELGPRTCMSCISQHGTEHELSEELRDHHRGRCTPIPLVPLAQQFGLSMPDVQSGETWFRRQSEARQVAMMGPGKWQAWQAGAFDFAQLSAPYSDPIYGIMRREATLQELTQNERVAA